MDNDELQEILVQHRLWLHSSGGEGKRADLQRQELNSGHFIERDLTDADFQRCELRRANFHKATLRRTNFREADLQNANLENNNFLLSAQLAGANVAGAKLPEAIAKFEGLKTIAEATSNAQKLFVALLGGCLYCWLTIGTTTDVALLTNSASSPLPVIGTALPIIGFYIVAPLILVALYFYFHLNLQRLWEALADLPAVFPDGRSLDKTADPWLLNGLVSAHFFRLRQERPALSRLQHGLSVFLAWWVVPLTLFVFWGRFLPLQHEGTVIHIALLAVAVGFGWASHRLARATLRGKFHKPIVWARAYKDFRIYKRVAGVLGACAVGVIFLCVSLTAFQGVPIGRKDSAIGPFDLRRQIPNILAKIGFSPFLDLYRADISAKPANWTGTTKEYDLVKGARLNGARIRNAYANRAFLANAELQFADLRGSDLRHANLQHADLSGANLTGAELGDADLTDAKLGGAELTDADLTDANLTDAQIDRANLIYANGLTKSQIDKAKKSGRTYLPKTLPP